MYSLLHVGSRFSFNQITFLFPLFLNVFYAIPNYPPLTHFNILPNIYLCVNLGVTNGALDPASQTKYQQLLSVIEEMSKDIRPCYAGSKSSAERLKRGIVYARQGV